MSSGLRTLRKIASKQAAAAPAKTEGKADRPVLASGGLLDWLWRLIRNGAEKKRVEDLLKEDKAVLAAAFDDAFLRQCDADGRWHTSADVGGGVIIDPATGQRITIETGDVQWQQQLRTRPVEVGSKQAEELNGRALELMPEYAAIALKLEAADEQSIEAFVADLGPELIAKWFDVKTLRRAPDAEAVRAEYFAGDAGRAAVESMLAAGAVELVGFAKIMRDPLAGHAEQARDGDAGNRVPAPRRPVKR